MILRSFFIRKGCYTLKEIMVLSTFLISKGQKRKVRGWAEIHRAEKGRIEKEFLMTK